MSRITNIQEDLLSILEDGVRKLKGKDISARDFIGIMGKLQAIRDSNLTREEEWFEKLKELKKAYEAIQELNLGKSDKYKSIFDKGKKKEIFLVA